MRFSLFLIIFLGFSGLLFAQQQKIEFSPEQTYRVFLHDGSEFVGKILKVEETVLVFKTTGGVEIKIPLQQIKYIETKKGKLLQAWKKQADQNDTRLFLMSTGRSLRQGQGYFVDYWIFFPTIGYGITDFLNLNGGISLFPFSSVQLFYLAPKIRIVHTSNFDLAGGILFLGALGSEVGDIGGMMYGVATIGSYETAFTIGAGWGFAGSDFANKPALMLGGQHRLSAHAMLVTENWFHQDLDGAVLSFGVRLIGRRLTGDLALWYFTQVQTGGFPFIPWLSFGINFGKK